MANTLEIIIEGHIKDGELHFEKEEYDLAISFYTKAYQRTSYDEPNIFLQCRILLDLMRSNYRLNRLEKAREYFDKALNVINNSRDESLRSQKAYFYAIKGKIYIKEGRYEDAIKQLTMAMKISDLNAPKIFIPQIYSDIAQAYIETYNYENAEITLITSLRKQLQNLKDSGDISNNLHDDFSESQRPADEKLEGLVKYLESGLKHNSSNVLERALLYDTIGSMFYLHTLYEQAVSCYKKSENIKSEKFELKTNYRRLASVEYLSKAYFAYAESDPEQLDWAITYNKDWRSIIRNTKVDDNILIAKLMINQGELHLKQEKCNASLSYYYRAKEIVEKSDKKDFNKNIVMSNIIYGHAMIDLKKGKFKTAETKLLKSMGLAKQELKGKEKIFIADIKDKIASVHRQQGQINSAKQMYREAIKIRKDICSTYDLDFYQSYYSKERLEKYRRIYKKDLPNDTPQLKKFKMIDKACRERAKIRQKYEEIVKFLDDNELPSSYNQNPPSGSGFNNRSPIARRQLRPKSQIGNRFVDNYI